MNKQLIRAMMIATIEMMVLTVCGGFTAFVLLDLLTTKGY